MKLVLEIECDNAAFADINTECARILRTFATRLDRWPGGYSCQLFDINGNAVGQAEFIGELA